MKLTFQINHDYLIAHTIGCWEQERFSSSEHKQDLLAFVNAVWERHCSTYELFANRLVPSCFVTVKQPYQALRDTLVEAEQAVSDIKTMPEYKKILEQTSNYMKVCQAQWQKNLSASEKAIKELTGFKLDKAFSVIITHPSLRNGHNFGMVGDRPAFAWGATEEWPNYITVYLWHEILHGYLDKSETSHALIQFVADNELRVRLNGGDYPPLESHAYLLPMMEEMLPRWRQYLDSPHRNLKELLKAIVLAQN